MQVSLWNPAAERTFGWSAGEMLGHPFLRAREGVQEPGPAIERVLTEGQNLVLKQRVPRKDGTLIDIVICGAPVRDANGAVVGAMGVISDVTEQLQIQRALAESEQRFRLLYEEAPVPYQSLDDEGRVLAANPCWLRRLGYAENEVLGRSFTDFLVSEQRWGFENFFAGFKRDEVPSGTDWELLRKDGTTLLARFRSRVGRFSSDRSRQIHSVFEDVTERRKTEAETLQTCKLEAVGLLAGGLAHDFNNALLIIIGNLQMARMFSSSSETHMRQLHNAEQACLRARDLTSQFLTFAKGGQPITQTGRIGKLIRDTAAFAVSGSNVGCEFEIDADHSAVNADFGQIAQVINNLVINADQAMPDGGAMQIGVANVRHDGISPPLPEGSYVRITVKDEGTGIAPEHVDRIFDPYFTTKAGGSGLGLSSCYSIIRNHGGHIGVESTPGVGTVFTIHLPCSTKCLNEPGDKQDEPILRGQERILIMDDEPAVREFSRMILEELGYTVGVAANVAEVVGEYQAAWADGNAYDAVILDLTIRGGPGGREAMQQLRGVNPEVRGIVCSGYSADAIMAKYRDHGFCGVVVKPYEVIDLAKALRKVLDMDPLGTQKPVAAGL
jgi:two-component system, cell cycle sensor histidine kinase and response regulator CckA